MVIVGMMSDFQSPLMLEIGSHFSFTPKKKINIKPIQNEGTACPATAIVTLE